MKRRFGLCPAAFLMVACSTSHGATPEKDSWCLLQSPGHPGDYADLPEAVAVPVRLDQMASAQAKLRSRSLRPLTAAQARSLAGPFPGSGEGNHYLVRSGIRAVSNASPAAYHRRASTVSGHLISWNPGSRLLLIT